MKQKLLSCTVCGLILGLLEICSGHEIPLSWTKTVADKDIVQFSDKSFQDCVVDCWRRLECNVIYYRATNSHCILTVHRDLTAVTRVPAQYVCSHKSEWAEVNSSSVRLSVRPSVRPCVSVSFVCMYVCVRLPVCEFVSVCVRDCGYVYGG